ncbi:protein disulfide oxidoreductase [Thiolapillus sp.]
MTGENSAKDKSPAPRWRRWAIDILLVLVVIFAVHLWQTRDLPVGSAPKLQGTMLTGETKRLEDYRGKPVLVHFWATWCPVCRLEEGSIDSLAEDYPVLTIATNSGDAEEIRKHLADNGLSFPVLMDESGVIGADWGIRGVPSSFIVDAQGQIRHVAVGYTTELGLRLRMWLAGM